jgi:hypothetical protein
LAGAAVGPVHHLGAVVGGADDDGVVGDLEIVELLQEVVRIAPVAIGSWIVVAVRFKDENATRKWGAHCHMRSPQELRSKTPY